MLLTRPYTQFDRTRLAAMVGNTSCLGLAHYFTGDQRYAEKAAENIRAWFMNPETSMTPTCKYAQVMAEPSRFSPRAHTLPSCLGHTFDTS